MGAIEHQNKTSLPNHQYFNREANLRMKSIKDKDGNVLTEEEKIKDRWKENYEDLYDMPGPLDTRIIQTISCTQKDDIEPDMLKEEVATALKHLEEGKAAGFDGIAAEEMKATGEIGINIIHKLCGKIWETEKYLMTGERQSLFQYLKIRIN